MKWFPFAKKPETYYDIQVIYMDKSLITYYDVIDFSACMGYLYVKTAQGEVYYIPYNSIKEIQPLKKD